MSKNPFLIVPLGWHKLDSCKKLKVIDRLATNHMNNLMVLPCFCCLIQKAGRQAPIQSFACVYCG